MLRPDDMQSFMLQLADATDGGVHNQVFVMRKVLTKVYQQGFDDGLRAADKDDFVRSQIEDRAKEMEQPDG